MTSLLTIQVPKGLINVRSKRIRQSVINIKYSNVPVNVPIILPSCIKQREETRDILDSPLLGELKGTHKLTRSNSGGGYSPIRRNDDQGSIEMIKKTSPKILSKKTRGSMFVSELWGEKHLKDVRKVSDIEKVHQAMKEAESKGLYEKIERLEKMYERRSLTDARDPDKVLEEFMTKGINSPRLYRHIRSMSGSDAINIEKIKSCAEDSTEGRYSVEPSSRKASVIGSLVGKELENSERCGTRSPQPVSEDRFGRKLPRIRNLKTLQGLMEEEERRKKSIVVGERKVSRAEKLPPVMKVTEIISRYSDVDSECRKSDYRRNPSLSNDSSSQGREFIRSQAEILGLKLSVLNKDKAMKGTLKYRC